MYLHPIKSNTSEYNSDREIEEEFLRLPEWQQRLVYKLVVGTDNRWPAAAAAAAAAVVAVDGRCSAAAADKRVVAAHDTAVAAAAVVVACKLVS